MHPLHYDRLSAILDREEKNLIELGMTAYVEQNKLRPYIYEIINSEKVAKLDT